MRSGPRDIKCAPSVRGAHSDEKLGIDPGIRDNPEEDYVEPKFEPEKSNYGPSYSAGSVAGIAASFAVGKLATSSTVAPSGEVQDPVASGVRASGQPPAPESPTSTPVEGPNPLASQLTVGQVSSAPVGGADVRDLECGGTVTATQRSFGAILVGESTLLLDGLKLILANTDFQIVASGSAVEELDLHHLQKDRSLLFIMGAGHDPGTAVRQVEWLKHRRPDARVAILGEIDRMTDMALLLQAGANACFPKEISTPIFLKSLELVMMGSTLLPSSIVSSIRDCGDVLPQTIDGSPPHLSAQEQRILGCLVEGHSNKAIARELGIAVATVKVHVKAILRKIRVQNRTQAAIWAMSHDFGECPVREGELGLSLAAIELLSPASLTLDENPISLPAAQRGSDAAVNKKMIAASSSEATLMTKSRSIFLQKTGKELRRFNTVPIGIEPGAET
jgi:DNA-binding NarL/FixJ family response regulator